MARAMGANSLLRIKQESTYGTAPSGNWHTVPFESYGLSMTQELIDGPVLGQGRNPQEMVLGAVNVEGSVVVPVDVHNIGFWLNGLMGAATVTGDGTPHVHTFTSGAAALPSYSIEVANTDITEYRLASGVMVESMQFNFTRTGPARCTVSLIGKSEDMAGTSAAGTPTSLALTRYSGFHATAKVGGVAFSDCESVDITLVNNLEKVETLTGDGEIAGLDPAQVGVNGTVTLRFSDSTYYDIARAGTPLELEFAFTINAETSVKITVWQARLEIPRTEIGGPGGIKASFTFKGERDSSTGIAYTVVLQNTTAAATYTG